MSRTALFVLAGLTIAACTREPEPFSASRAKAVTATVQAVNQSDRHLVVLTTDGHRLMVAAPNNVTNFDQIHQGDQILLTYHEGLVANVRRAAGSAQGDTQEITRDSASGRSPAGAPPTKAVGTSTSATVRIEAVDPSANTVTFTRPDGITRTLAVESPQGQAFVKQLTPGDQVDVTYREAAAVSIQPARR